MDLQEYSTIPSIWSSYNKNSVTSVGEENLPIFHQLWCPYIPVCILIL
jgi:hypothetical protein